MSENAKTITFVIIGLLAIVVGLVTRPSSAELDVETLVGQDLTKQFDSAEEAKRLRIVRFDEDTATLREFEVAEQDGLWSIPSKSGYPADAARQMAEAATSLMDRKILQIPSRNASEHEQFGVVDPLSPKLEPGQKGVGTRVTMSDSHGEPLVDLIIGKAVKDADGQRYVREAGRDLVYVIEIDRSKLSTSFEDWIEKDLLKLNAWDLTQVEIKDYSAEMGLVRGADGQPAIGVAWDPRAEMTLSYNDSESKWSPVRLRAFEGTKGEYAEFTLAEDEELDEAKLNDLKSALDDLQIVDVVRKPKGLSEDLKAGEDFMNNHEALRDLMSRGFTPAATAEGAPEEIISSHGEVIATMKNGTEYVLRFGNLTNVDGAGGEAEAAGESTSSAESDVNRYLFVMARFNETSVQQPELEDLPELPPKEAAATAEAAADAGQPANGEAGATGATEEATPAAADQTADEGASSADEPSDAAEATDTASEPAAEAETTAEDAKTADTAEAREAETANESGAATGGENAAEAGELEKVIAERKRIEQENQRKLDEYQETLKKGKKNVQELNLRFGDWYFVVDDEVFQKIRLSRDDVVKKKDKPEEGTSKEDAADNAAPPSGVPGLPPIPGVNP